MRSEGNNLSWGNCQSWGKNEGLDAERGNMQIEGTGKAKINKKKGFKNYLNKRKLNNIILK